jgi:hypothetical protein
MDNSYDNSDGMKYVKSLKDAVKRRFAHEYLAWLRSGRKGDMPVRGLLSSTLAKAVCVNLDALG